MNWLIKRFKTIDKEKAILITQWILIFILCILHAIQAGHYADFVPINGTFQNYNPVRRFLSGQIPYRDFADYLGLGHLYIGSLLTLLLGNTYRRSLIAFSFLTILSFTLLSLLLGSAISKNRKVASTVTILLLCMLFIQPAFYQWITGVEDIKIALESGLNPGNSARFIRGMILALTIFAIICGAKLYDRLDIKKRFKRNGLVTLVYISFIAGFAFTWSNDYGISCWVCIFIMVFWIVLSRERNFWKATGCLFLSMFLSIVSVIICVEILTLGHFTEWCTTIFGNGNYQSWYYLSAKSHYLYDVDFSYVMLIQAGLSCLYLIKIFKGRGKKRTLRYMVPAYANMVSFCAVNEYRLLSGGFAREYALTVLFVTVFYEILCLLIKLFKKILGEKTFVMIAFLIGFSWSAATLKDEVIFYFLTDKEGEYVQEMDGYMTVLGADLKNTTQFLNGEKFFATYASGQEVVANQFQPSGIDYIIHVLGDESREKYLQAFQTGDFKYTATIKETFNTWSYWEQRADWFFHRELLQNWHPVYSNTYELYWEKNDEGQCHLFTGDITVITEIIDDSTIKVKVQTDDDVNGLADLHIDYAVKKKDSRSAKLVFNEMLYVENTGTVYSDDVMFESNYLRASSLEYIPVTVVNGYGEITLTSYPKRDTYLELYSVDCKEIFTVTFSYVEVEGVCMFNDKIALKVAKLPKNETVLLNAEKIIIGDMECLCSVVSENDELYLLLNSDEHSVDVLNQIIEFNNNVYVKRKK